LSGPSVRSDGVEHPRGTKPTHQSLQKLLARSASPKPLCDNYAKQTQPDKHQDILPMAITFQIGQFALGRLAQFGRHLTPSVARIRVCSCYQLSIPAQKNGEENGSSEGQGSTSVVEDGRTASAIKAGLWLPLSAAEGLGSACPSFATKSRRRSVAHTDALSCHFFSVRRLCAGAD
jgi:hypothetical protein